MGLFDQFRQAAQHVSEKITARSGNDHQLIRMKAPSGMRDDEAIMRAMDKASAKHGTVLLNIGRAAFYVDEKTSLQDAQTYLTASRNGNNTLINRSREFLEFDARQSKYFGVAPAQVPDFVEAARDKASINLGGQSITQAGATLGHEAEQFLRDQADFKGVVESFQRNAIPDAERNTVKDSQPQQPPKHGQGR